MDWPVPTPGLRPCDPAEPPPGGTGRVRRRRRKLRVSPGHRGRPGVRAKHVGELDALSASAEAEAAAARAEYTEAKRRAVGLEKLETRHGAAFEASALRAEQGVLDEIASSAWHRKATS